jgi:uncharacterized protein YcsI (UPF0317 family)
MDKFMSAAELVRGQCRTGHFTGTTAGVARGFVQANLMIVPSDYAFEFLLFCQRNPRQCPLVEVLEPGRFSAGIAAGSDLRTDLPGYRVYVDGVHTESVEDINALWRDDFVSFLIGCSFSFEDALIADGIALRHIEQQRNVAMYKSSIACVSAGRLHGNSVVSMRPIKARDVSRAVQITARMPHVHGAPLHIGYPQGIGIADLGHPDFGDAVDIMDDEVPVFWGCGVTPQYIAQSSGMPFCITHEPGKMFVTDSTAL